MNWGGFYVVVSVGENISRVSGQADSSRKRWTCYLLLRAVNKTRPPEVRVFLQIQCNLAAYLQEIQLSPGETPGRYFWQGFPYVESIAFIPGRFSYPVVLEGAKFGLDKYQSTRNGTTFFPEFSVIFPLK